VSEREGGEGREFLFGQANTLADKLDTVIKGGSPGISQETGEMIEPLGIIVNKQIIFDESHSAKRQQVKKCLWVEYW
jgi:hypothetical protein